MNTTPTVRERFDEKFYRIVEDECILSKHRDEDGCFEKSDLDDVWQFLEKEIAEAEARGREEKEKQDRETMLEILNISLVT